MFEVTYLGLSAFYLILGIGNSFLLYRRFFSPIGIFGFVFGITFLLLAFPVIRYIPLNDLAVFVLFVTKVFFVIGTIAAILPLRSSGIKKLREGPSHKKLSRLRNFLFLSNIIGTVGVVLQWYYILRFFGGLDALLNRIAQIYGYRVSGSLGITNWAGYMASVGYAAVFLGGCYLGFNGKYKILSVWPLLIVLFHGLAMMGRASLVWGGLLFLNGFMLSRLIMAKRSTFMTLDKLLIALRLSVMGIILLGLMLGIRQVRGGGDNFRATAVNIRPYSNISYADEFSFWENAFLSNYVYVTGPIPALGRIVEDATGFPQNWGTNTFGSIFRRFGFSVPRYLVGVNIPFSFNIYTAIADWYLDFGWLGIITIPFAVGFLSGFLFEKALSGRISIGSLATLGFLFLWLEFSTFFSLSVQGFFWISLIWLWLGGAWVEKAS